MDAALINALVKSLEVPALAAGTYAVDSTVTLRVTGTVTKGEDYMVAPTTNIPWTRVVALLLEKLGAVSGNVENILVEALQEGLAQGDLNGSLAERLKAVESATARVKNITQSLPKVPRAGATKVKATVEVVA